MAIATFQPSFTSPTTFALSVRASSKKTSLNSAVPVICFSGRTLTPGWSIGTSMYDRPLWASASGSVRTTAKHQCARCASVVHTFCPFTTHWSPSSTARVCTFDRSDPAFGSEYPWHQSSSADWIFGRNRRFCSSVPYARSVGANSPSPKKLTRVGASALAYSSLKMICSAKLAFRPPYSSGQSSPTHRSRPSSFSHSTRSSQAVSSDGPPPPPSSANSPTRWSASHVRTSSRNAASAGVSRKSIENGRYWTARSSCQVPVRSRAAAALPTVPA